MDSKKLATDYLENAEASFRDYKLLAERSLDQISDPEFFFCDRGSNSIAVLVKHVAGNLRSRWTDFITTDGEKPFRDRDSEFGIGAESRDELMRLWRGGWQILFDTLATLDGDDLLRSVTIRGERHSVVGAINRQLTHYAYHVGQIVHSAKAFRAGEWRPLSVPPGRSKEFNEYISSRAGAKDPAISPVLGAFEFSRKAKGGDDD